MGFPLVPKSVTSNDLECRNGHYFVLFCAKYVTMVEVVIQKFSIIIMHIVCLFFLLSLLIIVYF